MTNQEQLELIAQARELVEARISFFAEQAMKTETTFNCILTNKDGTRIELNSWLTHLAEMEEHKNAFVEGNYNLAESVEGWYCQGCFERNDSDTPCQKLLTKAKRLLGVE